MPSFDIVNKVDLQEVDNAVNITKKIIDTRYDFRGSQTSVTLNKKEESLHIVTENDMKMKSVQDELTKNLVKRKIDPKVLDLKEIESTSKGLIKRDITIQSGIETELARKIVKMIKALKLKVQASIQDDQVRVTGKKIDDLQTVISTLKEKDLGIPLQFINMRS